MESRTINSLVRGIYLFRFRLPQEREIRIGRLGSFTFPAGCYIYTGSALGGLDSRLRRHRELPCSGRLHWHVDYLSIGAVDKSFAVVRDVRSGECELNRAVGLIAQAEVVAPGFGSSDCSCASHLHYTGRPLWPDYPGLESWRPAG